MASVEAAPRPHGESLICASSYKHYPINNSTILGPVSDSLN